MLLSDINPFLRFAMLQSTVVSKPPFNCAYDYRLFYILEDNRAKLLLSDRTVELVSGMLIFMRPATQYFFDGKAKAIVCNFDLTRNHTKQKLAMEPHAIRDFCEARITENDPPEELKSTLILTDMFEWEEALQKCVMHYRYPAAVSDGVTSAILKELLCVLAATALQTKKMPELISRIILYIQNHYTRPLTNAELSAAFGYHSFYLNRIFKEHTGITLHQAVIRERIRLAKRMLAGSAMSVEEIAVEVGFTERTQFCTAFRKHTGTTPSEYRKNKTLS